MEIIVQKSDNVIKFMTEATKQASEKLLILDGNWTAVGNVAEYDIIEVTELPDDFVGDKYKYINNQFELNPEY